MSEPVEIVVVVEGGVCREVYTRGANILIYEIDIDNDSTGEDEDEGESPDVIRIKKYYSAQPLTHNPEKVISSALYEWVEEANHDLIPAALEEWRHL